MDCACDITEPFGFRKEMRNTPLMGGILGGARIRRWVGGLLDNNRSRPRSRSSTKVNKRSNDNSNTDNSASLTVWDVSGVIQWACPLFSHERMSNVNDGASGTHGTLK